jgi:branched-chain amino acid transport system substrate-binding protein
VYIVGGLNRDRDSPELKEYLTEFQKRAGYAGENVGASVYSAVRLMCDAITRAGALEPAKGVRIRAYLKRAVAPASYLQP